MAAGVLTPLPAFDESRPRPGWLWIHPGISAAPDDAVDGKRPVPPAGEQDAQTRLQPSLDRPGDETRLAPLDVQTSLAPPLHPRTAVPPQSGSDAGSAHGGDSGVPKPVPSDNEGPLAIGQAFGPRYHIIRLLGIGGMGAVYQAWDAELGVAVAIKVIRPEVTADPAAARGSRAAVQAGAAAGASGHAQERRPHSRPRRDRRHQVHHDAVHRGRRISASILKREDKLPIAECCASRASIVSGLVAAHAAGVVHRDLKPANIMIDEDDDAMIMDFGIARSTGGPTEARPLPRRHASQTQPAAAAVQDARPWAPSSARSSTWRPSRREGRPSISVPTSTRSA